MNKINAAQDKHVWNSAKVIRNYASVDKLQKAETAILNKLKDRLSSMRMLDLGIGGGRTTLHFEPLVLEYHGTDYAENMVEASQNRFSTAKESTRFTVLDATSMKDTPEGYYDFILFSFNGIDCVSPDDRNKVFHEVRRTGKPGGYFAFSSHNIQYLPRMYKLRMRRNWKEFLYQFYRILMLIWYNGLPSKYAGLNHAVIRNGVEHFQLNIFYIEPRYQIMQLIESGFKNVRAYSHITGEELSYEQLGKRDSDAWLYYLCEI